MSLPVKPLPAEDLDDVVAHTRQFWLEAHGKALFMTGGTGFFGRWLLESWGRANDTLGLEMRATILTRDWPAFVRTAPHIAKRGDITPLFGDVRSFVFPPAAANYLVHAAADTAARGENAGSDVLETHLAGTRRVLEYAGNANAEKLLFISSGAVYGPQAADVSHVPEDYSGAPDPLMASSAYGEGKRVSEHLFALHALRRPCEVKIARCFAFSGPGLPLDSHYALGNFIRDALAAQPIQVQGDGTSTRSYLYAADMAIWLWTLLFRGQSGRAYNIGSDESVSIAQLAKTVRQTVESRSAVELARKPDVSRPSSRYVPSIERAKSELGLKVRIPLVEGIRRTACWYRLS
jgi:nucleoside-diphosphate-sugar epimerase